VKRASGIGLALHPVERRHVSGLEPQDDQVDRDDGGEAPEQVDVGDGQEPDRAPGLAGKDARQRQGEAEHAGRVDAVPGGPAVGAVSDPAGQADGAGDADQAG
jgi:hypothetical protein